MVILNLPKEGVKFFSFSFNLPGIQDSSGEKHYLNSTNYFLLLDLDLCNLGQSQPGRDFHRLDNPYRHRAGCMIAVLGAFG